MPLDHAAKSFVSFGAKSHAAAGFLGVDEMMDRVAGRSRAKQRRPRPMGRTSGWAFGMGFSSREAVTFLRKGAMAERTFPAPRKARPWERVTDRVRASLAERRMGAETMIGEVVHG